MQKIQLQILTSVDERKLFRRIFIAERRSLYKKEGDRESIDQLSMDTLKEESTYIMGEVAASPLILVTFQTFIYNLFKKPVKKLIIYIRYVLLCSFPISGGCDYDGLSL